MIGHVSLGEVRLGQIMSICVTPGYFKFCYVRQGKLG